tara:strand:- start:94 stop:1005 length:912 start_codon:yes stop_codon:yes gene_type:complete
MSIDDLLQFIEKANNVSTPLPMYVVRMYQIIAVLIIFIIVIALSIFTSIVIMFLVKYDTKKVQPNISKDTFNGWYLNTIHWIMETIVSSSGLLFIIALSGIIYRYSIVSLRDIPLLIWLMVVYVIIKFGIDLYRLSILWNVYDDFNRSTKIVKDNLTIDQELFIKLTKEDGSIRSGIAAEVADHIGNNQNTDTNNNINIELTTAFVTYLKEANINKDILKKLRKNGDIHPVELISPTTFNILVRDNDKSYSREFNEKYDLIGNNIQKIIIQTQSVDIGSIYILEMVIFITVYATLYYNVISKS